MAISDDRVLDKVLDKFFRTPLERTVESVASESIERQGKIEAEAAKRKAEAQALETAQARIETYEKLKEFAKQGVSKAEIKLLYYGEPTIPDLYEALLERMEDEGAEI